MARNGGWRRIAGGVPFIPGVVNGSGRKNGGECVAVQQGVFAVRLPPCSLRRPWVHTGTDGAYGSAKTYVRCVVAMERRCHEHLYAG